jgi:3-oxoacyl-[acyl-carrier-protein] synthase II
LTHDARPERRAAHQPPDVGLALGSYFTDTDYFQPLPEGPTALDELGRALGLGGPLVNTPAGCTAGNLSLAWAYDQVASGALECVIAGGMDVLSATAAGPFFLFGNLTDTLPRPFSADRDGFLISEGGAFLVLEPLDAARRRGARVRGEVVGAGVAHDAAHPTRPAEDARGLKRAIVLALQSAALSPTDIGYLNAHAPGTLASDPIEARAFREVFGPRGVPVSSTKGALGHAQGGANGLEAVACLLALEHQALPPTLNVEAPDPSFEVDLVVHGPRPVPHTYNLSVALAIGGTNSAVVFGRGDH